MAVVWAGWKQRFIQSPRPDRSTTAAMFSATRTSPCTQQRKTGEADVTISTKKKTSRKAVKSKMTATTTTRILAAVAEPKWLSTLLKPDHPLPELRAYPQHFRGYIGRRKKTSCFEKVREVL